MINVNPTRMELSKLKKRLVTARKGHKLLKDKRDEMVKQFLEIVKQNRILRRKVEDSLKDIQGGFSIAAALMSKQSLEEALCFPAGSVSIDLTSRDIMGVKTPVYNPEYRSTGTTCPYGYAFTSGELDVAVEQLTNLLPELIELAQTEKTVMLLADEIEKTRRRVNALENVMIPELETTIKYIRMKLDENERGNLTRLMKVKDMMIKQKNAGATDA